MNRSVRRVCLSIAPGAVVLAAAAAFAAPGQPPLPHAAQPLIEAERAALPPAIDARALPLWIDAAAIADLARQGGRVRLDLPVGHGVTLTLDLERQHGPRPDAHIVVVGPDGVERPVETTAQLWSGSVAGEPGSRVFLGLSPEQAHGWVFREGGTHLITTRRPAPGMEPVTVVFDPALLDAAAPAPAMPGAPICAGELRAPTTRDAPPTGPASAPDGGVCKVFDIAVETDNEFATRQGSTQAAVDYAVILVGASSSIFSRDTGMGMRIGYLRVWEATDPWTAPNTGEQLGQFRDYWQANMTAIKRATAHFLSGRGLGGGVAYVRVACDTNWSYGVSADLGGMFPFPLLHNSGSNWDVFVLSHELGHTFGTGHTHNVCEYNPVVDGCGLSGTSGCEAGTQDCSVASAKEGTIMSYCHICAGGMTNIKLQFGPRVSERLAGFIAGYPCGVTTLAAPPALDRIEVSPGTTVCSGTTVTFTAFASGADLRYQWYRNSVRIPGANGHSLTVTDPAHGHRFDVAVYSPCDLVTSLGTPMGKTLSIVAPSLSFLTHPSPRVTCPGGVATFAASAGGSPPPITYRWEIQTRPGGPWTTLWAAPTTLDCGGSAWATSPTSGVTGIGILPCAGQPSYMIRARAINPCLSITGAPAALTVCLPDLDCSGEVDFSDIQAFIALFAAQDPRADFTGDGEFDFSDVERFLTFYNAGC